MSTQKPPEKWRFAIGTTSRVPGAPGWHYLILDIDGKRWEEVEKQILADIGPGCYIQQTKHGLHIYTSIIMRFRPMLKRALRLGADRKWIRIAEKRGYAFLADKGPVRLPWGVRRMIIGCPEKRLHVAKRML